MKKSIIYLICGALVTVAIVVMLFFVFSGDNITDVQDVNIAGTWKVVAYAKDGEISLPENEFIVFKDEQAVIYCEKKLEPYASSSYTMDSSLKIKLPELSREYKVEQKSKNHIQLYENAKNYLYLLCYPKEDMSDVEMDVSVITGKWNVTYRNTDQPIKEYLVFEDGKMFDYRNDNTTPVATMEYTWNENEIIIPSINKTMVLHMISEYEIAFIETDTGFIWELKKVE